GNQLKTNLKKHESSLSSSISHPQTCYISRKKEMVHCTAGHSSNNIIMSIKIDSRYSDGGYGSVYLAILKNGLKWYWNFNRHNWEYSYVDIKLALKEINNSRHDLSGFLKEFLVHRDLHSGNILIKYYKYYEYYSNSYGASITDLGLIADENQEKAIKSQKQVSSLSSSKSHPLSCYISQ
ncbi:8153_t:CDS:2, partial [Diversispora eburnea]